MRQTHIAGERMFVDYAGTTLQVIDGSTGEVRTAQLFVAVLGGSSLTYAEATWSQTLPDWIGSHVRAYQFFGGVSRLVVCDNLRSAIIKACFHDPNVNRSYGEMASHYNTAILPARPYKPRDKAKVETGVLIATRFVIAKLRNRQYFSLTDLNADIVNCVTQINDRVSRHLGGSRRALFEEQERSELQPLPAEPYVFGEWKECRVGPDYHVEIKKHYYSVPYSLIREKMWARITANTVELFHRGERVAAHMRRPADRRHSTLPEHMASSHRRFAEWSPVRFSRLASEIGPNALALIEVIQRERPHPEHGFRSCIGILNLRKSYSPERLEAACGRALEIGAHSYRSLKSILQNGLDRKMSKKGETNGPAITHDNIRGQKYFH